MNDNINLINELFFKNSSKYEIPNKKDILKHLINTLNKINIKPIKNLNNIYLNIFNIENLSISNYIDFKYVLYDVIKEYNALIMPTSTLFNGGGIGGHEGAIFYDHETQKLYKKLDPKKYYMYDGRSNSNPVVNIDIELFIYLFFLTTYQIKCGDPPVINMGENSMFSVLNALFNILTINLIDGNINDIKIEKAEEKLPSIYYQIGNIKQAGHTNANIIDYKLGCYTVYISDKNINHIVSSNAFNIYRENKISLSKIDKLKLIAKYYNDFNSTSGYYGFRCEGVDKLFNKIYNKYLKSIINDKYIDSLNYYADPNSINATETETEPETEHDSDSGGYLNVVPDPSLVVAEPKLNIKVTINEKTYTYDPDNFELKAIANQLVNVYNSFKIYNLLDKQKIFPELCTLLSEFHKKLNMIYDNLNITNNMLRLMFISIIHHYEYINYFDYDNKVLYKTIKQKRKLNNKAPNYYIPPLLLFNELFSNINDSNKPDLNTNLDLFIECSVLNQFNAIFNNEEKLCCAFVGSSVITNTEDYNVRLIDFGHPILFNSANLTYLIKTVSSRTSTNTNTNPIHQPKLLAEDTKYKELFAIFMNFAYGALSYYFMLKIIINTSDYFNESQNKSFLLRVINVLYYAIYYTQGLFRGFPLITNNNSNNLTMTITTYTSHSIIKNKLKSLHNLNFNDYTLQILKPNTAQNNLETKLFTSTDLKDEYNKYVRCDLVKLLYVCKLIQLMQSKSVTDTGLALQLHLHNY